MVVLSDTHIRRGGRRALPAAAADHLRQADVILHAGDVLEQWLLDDLAELAPVHAVRGNNDVGLELPERLEVELAGVQVGMVHDSGARTGREARLSRWFPACALVVFGHSHIPIDARGLHGQRLLNPGSPTDRRTQPHHTLALLEVDDARIQRAQIVELD
ncbi:MAG: metallophosphoesterase family protein [Acidimicrobiales bacterium]